MKHAAKHLVHLTLMFYFCRILRRFLRESLVTETATVFFWV